MDMNTVYLAGSWHRKEELRPYADLFRRYGIDVLSRWLYEPASATSKINDLPQDYLEEAALRDIEDVYHADVLVLFSNGYDSAAVGGGRFFEAGLAFAQSKPIITVGEPEMIFQKLSEDELFYTVKSVHEAVSLVLNWQTEIAQYRFREKARESNKDFVNVLNAQGGTQYALDFGDAPWGGI